MLRWDWSKDEWAYHVTCCRSSLLIRNGSGFVSDASENTNLNSNIVKTKGCFVFFFAKCFSKCIFLQSLLTTQLKCTELLKILCKINIYPSLLNNIPSTKKKAKLIDFEMFDITIVFKNFVLENKNVQY